MTFSVSATGAGTRVYQWKKDNKAIDSNASPGYNGVDTPTLYIHSFTEEHEGRYTCVIKNEDRVLESDFADLAGEVAMTT